MIEWESYLLASKIVWHYQPRLMRNASLEYRQSH